MRTPLGFFRSQPMTAGELKQLVEVAERELHTAAATRELCANRLIGFPCEEAREDHAAAERVHAAAFDRLTTARDALRLVDEPARSVAYRRL